MPDLFKMLGLMWAAALFGAGSWWAWYALVRYNQRSRYARDVAIAAKQGVPPPDPPPPPDVFRVIVRVSLIGGLVGLAGAAVAVLIATLNLLFGSR
jgi:hypothetical protein